MAEESPTRISLPEIVIDPLVVDTSPSDVTNPMSVGTAAPTRTPYVVF